METEWKTVCNPGYFGATRDAKFCEYDALYGVGNWRIAWQVGEVAADFLGACALYEDAYYAFLEKRHDIRIRLLREACDVYDDQVSNVHSRFDYSKQETERTHVQDIAIRRVILRMGLVFNGGALIRIRDKDGDHPLSMALSPGQVPFHRPELIVPPPPGHKKPWWHADSVEDFYQSNKVLQICENAIPPQV